VSRSSKNFLYAFVSTLEVQRLPIVSTVSRFGKNFVVVQAATSVASDVVNDGIQTWSIMSNEFDATCRKVQVAAALARIAARQSRAAAPRWSQLMQMAETAMSMTRV
jgi:hypothetical protein